MTRALILFAIIFPVVTVFELVLIQLAAKNRVIDAIGDFWSNVAYIAMTIVVANSIADAIACLLSVAAGILAAIVIHDRLTQPVPLTFFTHLGRGEDTQ